MEQEAATVWASCLRGSVGVNQGSQQRDQGVRPLASSQRHPLSSFHVLLLANGGFGGSGGHGGQLIFRKRAVERGKFLFDELLIVRDSGG